jgi:hypothetical protein
MSLEHYIERYVPMLAKPATCVGKRVGQGGEEGRGEGQEAAQEQVDRDPLYLFRANQLPGNFGEFFRHPRMFSGTNGEKSSTGGSSGSVTGNTERMGAATTARTSRSSSSNSSNSSSDVKTPTPHSRYTFDSRRREAGSLFYIGPANSGAYFHIHTCAW